MKSLSLLAGRTVPTAPCITKFCLNKKINKIMGAIILREFFLIILSHIFFGFSYLSVDLYSVEGCQACELGERTPNKLLML